MKHVRLAAQLPLIDYQDACALATRYASNDPDIEEPVLMVWHDRKRARISPGIPGACTEDRWHDYALSHCGCLTVSVGDAYDFAFADAAPFASGGTSPYLNLSDGKGGYFLCLRKSLHALHQLDEYTSKLT